MKKIAADVGAALEYKGPIVKKFILATIIGMTMIGSAAAHQPASNSHRHNHHGHRHHHHHGYYWVPPVIVGGLIGYGYGATRYYNPPPVYYYYDRQPATMHYTPAVINRCTQYVYQDSYGNTIREETRCE